MKTLLMKFCCLLLLITGAVILLSQFGLDIIAARDALIEQLQAENPEHPLARMLDPEGLTPGFPLYTVLIGVIFAVSGGLGLLPSLAGRKDKRAVEFETGHGKVAIRLDAVQKSMNQIIGRIPQVKKAKVGVKPSRDRKKALIHADVTLVNDPNVTARQTAGEITGYIVQTASQILGLEDLAKIDLTVDGYSMDTKAAAKAIANAAPESGNPVEMTEVLAPVAVGAYAGQNAEASTAEPAAVTEHTPEVSILPEAEETAATAEEAEASGTEEDAAGHASSGEEGDTIELGYEAPPLGSENEDDTPLNDASPALSEEDATGETLPPLISSEADEEEEADAAAVVEDDPLSDTQAGLNAAFGDDDASDVTLPPLGDDDAESLTAADLSGGDTGDDIESSGDGLNYSSEPDTNPDHTTEAPEDGDAADGEEPTADAEEEDSSLVDLGGAAEDDQPDTSPEDHDKKKRWGFF